MRMLGAQPLPELVFGHRQAQWIRSEAARRGHAKPRTRMALGSFESRHSTPAPQDATWQQAAGAAGSRARSRLTLYNLQLACQVAASLILIQKYSIENL